MNHNISMFNADLESPNLAVTEYEIVVHLVDPPLMMVAHQRLSQDVPHCHLLMTMHYLVNIRVLPSYHRLLGFDIRALILCSP